MSFACVTFLAQTETRSRSGFFFFTAVFFFEQCFFSKTVERQTSRLDLQDDNDEWHIQWLLHEPNIRYQKEEPRPSKLSNHLLHGQRASKYFAGPRWTLEG